MVITAFISTWYTKCYLNKWTVNNRNSLADFFVGTTFQMSFIQMSLLIIAHKMLVCELAIENK